MESHPPTRAAARVVAGSGARAALVRTAAGAAHGASPAGSCLAIAGSLSARSMVIRAAALASLAEAFCRRRRSSCEAGRVQGPWGSAGRGAGTGTTLLTSGASLPSAGAGASWAGLEGLATVGGAGWTMEELQQ